MNDLFSPISQNERKSDFLPFELADPSFKSQERGLERVRREWIGSGEGLEILEESSAEFEEERDEDREIDEFEFEDYRARTRGASGPPSLRSTEPTTYSNRETTFTPFSMDSDQRFTLNAFSQARDNFHLNLTIGGERELFDPVVGSPSKRFPPGSRFTAGENVNRFTGLPTSRPGYDGWTRFDRRRVEEERENSVRRDDFQNRFQALEMERNQIKMEEESRYVLVENLPVQTKIQDLEGFIVSKFRIVLKSIHVAQLRSVGAIVLVFFDNRYSKRVVEELEWERGFGRRLNVKCISRESFQAMSKEASTLLSSSEGIVALSTRSQTGTTQDSQFPLSPQALKNHLASFGELKSLRVIQADQFRNQVFVLEFFDDRVAERVYNAWNGLKIGGSEVVGMYGVAEKEVVDSAPKTLVSRPATPLASRSLHTPGSIRSLQTLTTLSPCSSEFTPRIASSSSSVLQSITNKYNISATLSGSELESDLTKPQTTDSADLEYPSLAPFSIKSNSKVVSNNTSSIRSFPPSKSSSNFPPKLEKNYGIYREDAMIPLKNILRLDWIEQGLERRTTLMLKNIPNRINAELLGRLINEVVPNKFDFLYLRIDFSNNCNVGYGFINFIDIESLYLWAKSRIGQRWDVCSSEKVYVASFATIQGKEALIAKFRNSSVMDEQPAFRPRIFYSSGPLQGQPEPFPPADDIKRKARSVSNLQNIGLFPTQKPIFKITRVNN